MGQRQTTHVANANDEDIWVKVDADRQYVTLQSFQGSVSGSVKGVSIESSLSAHTEYNWEYANKHGFTRIASRSYLGFNPDSSRPCVYITILTQSGSVVCHCYCMTTDFSVIVDKDGYIRETQYGNIWVDKDGKRH